MARLFKFSLVFAMFILSGCSAQWHLKKAIQKNPNLLKVREITIDTLVIMDSFYQVDSFTMNEIDTFITDTGKIKITLYRYKDRFVSKVEIKRDTFHFTKIVECPPTITQLIDNEKTKSYMLYAFLGGCFITILLTYYGKKLDNSK